METWIQLYGICKKHIFIICVHLHVKQSLYKYVCPVIWNLQLEDPINNIAFNFTLQ